MQFNIVIERDEDGRYVAECLDLPGCLSEGESWIEIPVKGEVAVRFDTSGVLQYAQAA
jgi:hypothetical protein